MFLGEPCKTFYFKINYRSATVAQMVELLICNQPVGGSNPLGGSWGISSAGRASALHAEGRRFEPAILHHLRV